MRLAGCRSRSVEPATVAPLSDLMNLAEPLVAAGDIRSVTMIADCCSELKIFVNKDVLCK